ncbi:MAG: threonine/serine exporter family protein [Clostridia bacterium]|nr:threonine/serine exporter family protein [Clostridia bacterium]
MTEELLNVIIILGERMLVAGAEVHRVEESIRRLCCAYGAVRADVYTTTSNMIVTAETADGHFLTQTRRMSGTGNDMAKVHALNDLARNVMVERPAVEELRRRVDEASKTKVYPRWLKILSYAMVAGAFTVFFGASVWQEAAVSFAIGGIVGVAAQLIERFSLNKALDRFIGSLIACLLTFAALRLGLVPAADKIIIGNIMTLIPGTGLTNALRDLFTGDVITGILRAIEAVLLALAIAAGYITAVFLMGGGA